LSGEAILLLDYQQLQNHGKEIDDEECDCACMRL